MCLKTQKFALIGKQLRTTYVSVKFTNWMAKLSYAKSFFFNKSKSSKQDKEKNTSSNK